MKKDDVIMVDINRQCIELFDRTRESFATSTKKEINELAKKVPSTLFDNSKSLKVVFVGQYSAGKSTILSLLTGKKLKIGQAITTTKCEEIDWQGICVVDTPGIHTQNNPDHDEITYRKIAEADLLIFVMTNEGFSGNLGEHFRKLLIEKCKGPEMMLVVNKMESTELGNTKEQQRIFIEKNLLPVISPEYQPNDLYLCFVDAKSYIEAQTETDPKEKEWLEQNSGIQNLINTINTFVKDKNLLGQCTTALFQEEQLLIDALSEFKVNDICIDGTNLLLDKQRRLLLESEDRIKQHAHNLIRKRTQKITSSGQEIANNLSSKSKKSDVEEQIKNVYSETANIYSETLNEFKTYIEKENTNLSESIKELFETSFAKDFKVYLEDKIANINVSDSALHNINKGAQYATDFSSWLSKMSTGKNAKDGFSSIFQLATYSGSNTHQAVLQIGNLLGHNFKPWEAVKIAGNIGKAGKILGVGGALLGLGAQFWQDHQDKKQEATLLSARNEIRGCFNEAARAINLEFDTQTQSWIEQNYSHKIQEIDQQIKELQDIVTNKEKEYNIYQTLLAQTRNIIANIQQ